MLSSSGGSFFDQNGIPVSAFSLRDLRGDDPIILTLTETSGNTTESFTVSQVDAETDLIAFANGADLRVAEWHNQVDGKASLIQGGLAAQPYFYKDSAFFTIGDSIKVVSIGASTTLGNGVALTSELIDTFSVMNTSDFEFICINDSSSGTRHGYYGTNGDTVSTLLTQNYGSTSLYKNGELQDVTNRNDVYSVISGNSDNIIGFNNEDMTSWVNPRIGRYLGFGSDFTGLISEYISYPNGDKDMNTFSGVLNQYYNFY